MSKVWKIIKGFENFEVSEDGEVKNICTGVIRKHYLSRGYPAVKIGNRKSCKHFTIHQLLGICFIPNPNNYKCINHKNGNKLDYSLSNLEWCSYQQNIRHALDTGLLKRPSGKFAYSTRSVINTATGNKYCTIKEAAEKELIPLGTLRCYLSGHRTNKTALKYA
jgi:hypothetical protein